MYVISVDSYYNPYILPETFETPEDAIVVYSNEESDLPYDHYDDLYHTFMGSDDEVRDGCWE